MCVSERECKSVRPVLTSNEFRRSFTLFALSTTEQLLHRWSSGRTVKSAAVENNTLWALHTEAGCHGEENLRPLLPKVFIWHKTLRGAVSLNRGRSCESDVVQCTFLFVWVSTLLAPRILSPPTSDTFKFCLFLLYSLCVRTLTRSV